MTYKLKRYSPSALATVLLLCCLQTANAQAVTPPAAPATVTSSPAETATVARAIDQYRIGPRDVLNIRVSAGRLVAELSMDSVEVDECGRIPLPSVEHETQNEIEAAGKTRTELAEELRTFYKKYKKNPQVVVIVKEYNSQPVAINGAIIKPGQFQLRRPVRLQELVQFYAGGPTEKAGGSIQLARMADFNPCTASAPDASSSFKLMVINLKETLAGVEQANPYLQPGDVITVPDAKEAYVVGNVLRPGPILLKDDSVTLSQAIAMAGGTMPDSKRDKILIIRQDRATGTRRDMTVDYEAIEKRQQPDVALLPNDIIKVETSGGRRLLRSLLGTIVPSVGQLPVQVIR
ncbi:MAG: polysaccharide biosynthesis/export protein [Acidobacteriota bacterium]|jgi:polysaccharide export outer membrane protein|nr:polysaccharide biosynthesis/export protein [Acidobacteriota bacterium]